MGNRSIWIRINPSFECSRDCDFCFVKIFNLYKPKREGLIDRCVEVYKNHVNKYGYGEYNGMSILGGEPTEYWDVSTELFRKFKEVTPKIGLGFLTEGNLLTLDKVEWCRKNNIALRISAGHHSVNELKDMFNMVSNGCPRFGVHIFLSPYNLERLNELFDLCYNYTRIVKLSKWWDLKESTDVRRKLLLTYVPPTIERLLEKNMIFNPQGFYDYTPVYWTTEFRHTCGSKIFTIDPDGSVRWCVFGPQVIGNIFDTDFDFNECIKKANVPRFHFNGIAKCEKCDVRMVCGSGCPLYKQIHLGRTDVPHPMCAVFKKVIPLVLKMRDKWIQLPESKDWAAGVVY